MGKRTSVEADLWHGVQDAKKRKQIQDRLAQRARRERLASLKDDTTSSITRWTGTALARRITCRDPELSSSTRHDTGCSSSSLPSRSSYNPSSTCLISKLNARISQPIVNHTIYSALFHNGVILGLACSSSTVSKSRPAPVNTPESLRPIPLQMEEVHFEWIDRFPLPKLRHSMIRFSDVINSEEFLADIFTGQTFTIQPGRPSWDPDAWEATPEFREKWGYLF